MIQSVCREWDGCAFTDIAKSAKDALIDSTVDCQKDCFLAPESMSEEIKKQFRLSGQAVPKTRGEVAAVIYNSLSDCYAREIKILEQLTGKVYRSVHIVGGGSTDPYLNELTIKRTKKIVITGPTEATAMGNLAVQMISFGVFTNLNNARAAIARTLT